ncbi:MAG: hypothetical protein QW660_03600 [Candidatus Bathyarchaeia archaeon]
MPRCPKCGAEIEELIDLTRELVEYRLYLAGDRPEWEKADVVESENVCYYCPECHEEIFNDFKKAIAFLKGEETD